MGWKEALENPPQSTERGFLVAQAMVAQRQPLARQVDIHYSTLKQ